MSNYTPTTEMVKVRYAIGHGGLSDDMEDVRAEAFDRWLAAEKAKWQAEAWERGRDDEYAYSVERAQMPTNPYVKGSDDRV